LLSMDFAKVPLTDACSFPNDFWLLLK